MAGIRSRAGRVTRSILAVGLLFFGAASARAGLVMSVQESGGPVIPILDDGIFDTNTTDPGVITVNTSLLNSLLTKFQFSSLGTKSNSTFALDNDPASLTQTGTVVRTFPGGGAASIAVFATDTDYFAPDGNPKFLGSSSSYTVGNTAAGDTQTFQSFFGPGNSEFATTIPSPLLAFIYPAGVGPNSDAATAPSTALGSQPNPFSLTNQMIITLGPAANAGTLPSSQFTGSTSVIGTAAVPEPSSLILLGTGLLGLGIAKVRRTRRSAA